MENEIFYESDLSEFAPDWLVTSSGNTQIGEPTEDILILYEEPDYDPDPEYLAVLLRKVGITTYDLFMEYAWEYPIFQNNNIRDSVAGYLWDED